MSAKAQPTLDDSSLVRDERCLEVRYGHPHPDVLADLAGTRILRTDTDGMLSVAAE